jgi:hypothetical protein
MLETSAIHLKRCPVGILPRGRAMSSLRHANNVVALTILNVDPHIAGQRPQLR